VTVFFIAPTLPAVPVGAKRNQMPGTVRSCLASAVRLNVGSPDTFMQIRPFQLQDEEAVVSLWQKCGLVRPWNDPHKDIRRKLAVRPDLFLVCVLDGQVVACVIAGYEGPEAANKVRGSYGVVRRKKVLPGTVVMGIGLVVFPICTQLLPIPDGELVCACTWATMLLGQVKRRLELVCAMAMRSGAVVLYMRT
jgi:hypothetical protein